MGQNSGIAFLVFEYIESIKIELFYLARKWNSFG
jgi:hypothetical protein